MSASTNGRMPLFTLLCKYKVLKMHAMRSTNTLLKHTGPMLATDRQKDRHTDIHKDGLAVSVLDKR